MHQPSPLNLSSEGAQPAEPSVQVKQEENMLISPSERDVSSSSAPPVDASLLLMQSQIQQILQQSAIAQQQQFGEALRTQLMALHERVNGVPTSQVLPQIPSTDRKTQAQLQMQHQLAAEQQQLLNQLHPLQRHYLLQQGISPGLSPGEAHRLWQDSMLDGSRGLLSMGLTNGVTNGEYKQDPTLSHPLYQNGHCVWMGCNAPCESYFAFLHHLGTSHPTDDRSSAQVKVQAQILEQLERQVGQERRRLKAMQAHLLAKQSPDTTTPVTTTHLERVTTSSPEPASPVQPASSILDTFAGANTRSSVSVPRRRVPDKNSLPISADIARNREFYRTTDIRPPYTYAALIRQAILDHDDKQLTLNEIYNWFQDTFAYFRRNAATWKNAVRHNLSLHKCFMRVENVKGAVWTVDEAEFYRRRPQRLSSTGAYRPPELRHNHRHSSLAGFMPHSGQNVSQLLSFAGRSGSPGPDFSRLTDPDEEESIQVDTTEDSKDMSLCNGHTTVIVSTTESMSAIESESIANSSTGSGDRYKASPSPSGPGLVIAEGDHPECSRASV